MQLLCATLFYIPSSGADLMEILTVSFLACVCLSRVNLGLVLFRISEEFKGMDLKDLSTTTASKNSFTQCY